MPSAHTYQKKSPYLQDSNCVGGCVPPKSVLVTKRPLQKSKKEFLATGPPLHPALLVLATKISLKKKKVLTKQFIKLLRR